MKIRKFILEKTNYFLNDENINFLEKAINHKIIKYFFVVPLFSLVCIRYISLKKGDFIKLKYSSAPVHSARKGIVSEKHKFWNNTHGKIICIKTNKEESFNMTFLIEIMD